MLWTDAAWIIAPMKNKKAFRNRPMHEFVGDAMGAMLALVYPHTSVSPSTVFSSTIRRTGPFPTF